MAQVLGHLGGTISTRITLRHTDLPVVTHLLGEPVYRKSNLSEIKRKYRVKTQSKHNLPVAQYKDGGCMDKAMPRVRLFDNVIAVKS